MVGIYLSNDSNMKEFLRVVEPYTIEFCILTSLSNISEYEYVITDSLNIQSSNVLALGRELETLDDIIIKLRVNSIDSYKIDSFNDNLNELKESCKNYVDYLKSNSEEDIDCLLSDIEATIEIPDDLGVEYIPKPKTIQIIDRLYSDDNFKFKIISARLPYPEEFNSSENIKDVISDEIDNDEINNDEINSELKEDSLDLNIEEETCDIIEECPEETCNIIEEYLEDVIDNSNKINIEDELDKDINECTKDTDDESNDGEYNNTTNNFNNSSEIIDTDFIEMFDSSENAEEDTVIDSDLLNCVSQNIIHKDELVTTSIENSDLVITGDTVSKHEEYGNIDVSSKEYVNIILGTKRDADREVIELNQETLDNNFTPDVSESEMFVDEESSAIESPKDNSILMKNKYNSTRDIEEIGYTCIDDICNHVLSKFSYSMLNTNANKPKFNWLLTRFKEWNYTKVVNSVKSMRGGFKSRRGSSSKNHLIISLGKGVGGSTFAVNLATALIKERQAEHMLNVNSLYKIDKGDCLLIDMDFDNASLSNSFMLNENIQSNLMRIFTDGDICSTSENNILGDLPKITQNNVPMIPTTSLYTLTEENKKIVLNNNWSVVMTAINEQYSTAVYDCGSVPDYIGLTDSEYQLNLSDFIKPLCNMRSDAFIWLCFDMSNSVNFNKSLDLLLKLDECFINNNYPELSGVIVPIKATVFGVAELENRLKNIRNRFKICNPLESITELTSGFIGYNKTIEDYCLNLI